MGKPPGVNPAAPMRRRSCRGAGEYDRHASPNLLKLFLAADPLHQRARSLIGSIVDAAILGATKTRSEAITPVRSCVGTHAAENTEAPLLAVIETRIKRAGRVCQFLQGRTRFRHCVCTPLHQFGWIGGAGLSAASRFDPCCEAIDAQLLEVPGRLLKGRPILFLFGVESEPCPKACNSRIAESAHVFNRGLPAARGIGAILRLGKRRAYDQERSSAGKNGFEHCDSLEQF